MVLERGSSTAMMRAAPDPRAQALKRRLDGGGVMREIVVHGDAVDHAAHFHAPLDAAKCLQRQRGTLRSHAGVMRRADRRQAHS